MIALNFSPFPELKTQRLLLRKLEITDANEIFFLRSNEEVLRYLGREPAKTVAEAEEFISKIKKAVDENDSVLWGITFLSDPSTIIGTICLWNFEKENYRSEIGYILHPDHWRKGIMKEAINSVVDYGFDVLGLHSIGASLSPENIASSSVLESAGFVKEAHLKESFYFNGKFTDKAIYSRLKKAN
ncbi:MAG: GNAT family N-acetyltransferase [Bacteroidetes bacterium]|nr:MAG: GNAT family N-acetyltransferase [Bacteroidota bacterium]